MLTCEMKHMRIVRYKILEAVFDSNKTNCLDLKGIKEAGDIYTIRILIIWAFNHVLLILIKWRTRWARHTRDMKCKHNFSEKPEAKRSFRRHRCRWDDNIERYLTEIRYTDVKCVKWIHLAQNVNQRWILVKSNGESGPMKGTDFSDYPRNYSVLKK